MQRNFGGVTTVEESLSGLSGLTSLPSNVDFLKTILTDRPLFSPAFNKFSFSKSDGENCFGYGETSFDFDDERINWINILNISGPCLIEDLNLYIRSDTNNSSSNPYFYKLVLARILIGGKTYRFMDKSYIGHRFHIGYADNDNLTQAKEPLSLDTIIPYGFQYNSQFYKINNPMFSEDGLKIDYWIGYYSNSEDAYINVDVSYKLI